ncbi:MAG: ABC transporter permease [Actinobacteria bacterium]|jgi:ABC-2 type transport system permease protein|nr:ABC transporter permease [Actinomycetota bacterium]
MSKTWLIARQEYLKNVRRRSFLLVTFGLPVMMLVLMGISILSSIRTSDASTLGYVDKGGVLSATVDDPGFQSFAGTEEAIAALQDKLIQGFYVVAPGYAETGEIELFYWDRQPGAGLQERFDAFLRDNLVGSLPPDVATRALAGPQDLVVGTADGSRESGSAGLLSLVLPFALGLFISFALMCSAGYLLRAVTDEKENRTIEIVTTSVSPKEFIVGKAAGLVGVALTQVVLWAVVIVAGLAVVSLFTDALSGIAISWGLIGVLAAFFVPLFVLAVALVVTLGVAVADARQGQQLVGAFNVLFLLPLFFSPLLGSNPDGPLMVFLTLFPTTSLLTIAVRWGATIIPLWQIIVSWAILVTCAGFGFWLAPRVFRQGMLRYGKRMSLRGVIAAVRAPG